MMMRDWSRGVGIVLMCLFVVTMYGQQKISDQQLNDYYSQYEAGEYEKILQDVESKDFEVDYPLLRLTGQVFHKLKDYDKAVLAYSMAIDMQDDSQLLLYRAAAFLELGEMDLCLYDLNKLKKLRPEDPYLYFTLGNYSYDMGDYKHAQEQYEQGLTLNPDDKKMQFMLALVNNRNGHYKKAVKSFASLTAEFPMAEYNIAVSYLQNEQYQLALESFNKVENNFTDYADFFFLRAETQYYLGDKENACVDYSQAATLGDEEAGRIHTKYCVQNKKKQKTERISSGEMRF